jgi:hypothetical protein
MLATRMQHKLKKAVQGVLCPGVSRNEISDKYSKIMEKKYRKESISSELNHEML